MAPNSAAIFLRGFWCSDTPVWAIDGAPCSHAGVPVENSVRFYLALRKAGVPAELHAYEKGVHGVGLAPNDPVLRTWTDRLFDWLEVRGFGK